MTKISKFYVIDDASTDGTLDIANQFACKYPDLVRVLALKENAHSRGFWPGLEDIKKIDAKFLAFCDGDDYWINTKKLANQVRIFKNHENLGIVHSDCFQLIFQDGNWKKVKRNVSEVEKAKLTKKASDFINGNNVKSSTAMILKRAINFEFFEDARRIPAKDWLLYVDVCSRWKIFYQDEIDVAHRILPSGIWNGMLITGAQQMKNSIREYCAKNIRDRTLRLQFKLRVYRDRIRLKVRRIHFVFLIKDVLEKVNKNRDNS